MLVVLVVLLAAAAIYQLTLGGDDRLPLCGPETPGAAPDPDECVTPSAP